MPVDPLAAQRQGAGTLEVLVEDLRRAREEVAQLRRLPLVHDQLRIARQRLLTAMESYAAELGARGLPLPWKLRDELRLQHRIGMPRDSYGSRR